MKNIFCIGIGLIGGSFAIDLKKQHPELDIRFVFMNPKGKIRKGSKTTYADFCDKNDIIWADKTIPTSWYNEKK